MSNPGVTSLISWWSLDEESGTRNDSHGTNHLTDVNTVLYAAGKQGNAADFEVSNFEYLTIASNATLQMGDIDFTIAFWMNLESTGSRTFVSKYDTAAGKREYLVLFEGGELRFGVSADGNAVVTLDWGPTPSLATWYFVVAWHDATANTINIQVNDGTPTSAAHSTGLSTGTGTFMLGALSLSGTPYTVYMHDGLLDEVSIWKRVLTDEERTWLFNSGDGRAYSELATIYEQAVAGTLTSAGVIALMTGKSLAGTLTTAGVVTRMTARALAGVLDTAGAVARQTTRVLEGTVSSAGSVTKSVGKALAGALSTSGVVSTTLAGAVTGLIHLTARVRAFALRVRQN